MSAAKVENFPPISEPTVTKPERSAKQPKPAPAPQPEPERKPRRMARRDTVNRAYYVCNVSPDGTLVGFIAKFPTVGQARKYAGMVCSAAKVPITSARIVRTVIVE